LCVIIAVVESNSCGCTIQEKRKKEREEEEKRLAGERAAEEERRKAVEVGDWLPVNQPISIPLLQHDNISFFFSTVLCPMLYIYIKLKFLTKLRHSENTICKLFEKYISLKNCILYTDILFS